MNASSTAQSAKEKPTRAEAIQAAIEAVGGKTSTATTTKQTAVSKPEQAKKQTRAEAIQAAIDAVSKPELSRQITPIGAQTPQSSTAVPTVSTEIAPFSEYTAQNRQRRREAMQAAVDAVSPKNARKTMFSLQADADVQNQLRDYSFSLAGDRNAQLNRESEMKSMQDDERALYLYLVKNRGIEEAEEYRRELGLSARALPGTRDAAENAGFLGKLGIAAVSGFTDAIAGNAAAADALRGRTPLNNPLDAVSGTARESINSGVGKTVFDLVKTGANQLPAMAMGYATGFPGLQTVLMSTGAGGMAYKQALAEGMTKEQATTYGVINGLSEYLTEALVGVMPGPNGKIDLADTAKEAIAKNVNSAVGRFAANYGVNSLGEATEEYLQEVLDPLFRYIATGEAQDWDISELWSEDALYSALLGGLSGGMLGGIIDGINGYRAESDYNYYQAALDSGEAVKVWLSEDVAARTDVDTSLDIAEDAKFAPGTAVTEETVQQVALFAEATQTPVLWVKPGVLPSGVNAQEAGGVVFLSADANKPLEALLAHETLHSTEGTQAHTALLEEVDAAIRAENPILNLDSVAEQYQQNCKTNYNENMTIEAAKNEVAAQYVESNLLNSPLAMQLIMSRNSGLIREIAAKWNYRLAYRQADEAGRRSLRLQKDFAEGLRQRQRPTAEQIEKTAWKVNNGIPIQNANVHYSRMLNQGTFSDAVDDVMVMSNEQAVAEAEEGNFVRVMDHTPDVILQNVADAEDLEVIVSFHSLYLAARKDGVLPGHYHNLGNITKSLPQILSDPDAIVRINNGRLNLFTRMPTEKGSNGILSVELNTVKDINDAYNKYNLVISMFSEGDRYARNVITKNAVEVEYKKENLSQVNPQLYEWLAIVNEKSSNDSTIPQGTADVNTQYTQNGEKYSRRGESYDQLMGRDRAERDAEYMELAKDPEKNGEKLRQLVEQAAKNAGYNSPLLYHGTQSFGFTSFDLSKMDDGRSIFLTSNPEIASSYSGISGSRRISDASNIDVDSLSVQQVAQMLNHFPPESGIDYAYSYVSGKNEVAEQVNKDIARLNELIDTLKERFATGSPEISKLNHLQNVIELGNRDSLSAALWVTLNKSDVFEGYEDFVNGLEQNIRLLKKAPDTGGFVVEKSLEGYSIEVSDETAARNELLENMRRGNYALYAKLGDSLSVDANGDNWNALDFRAKDSKYEIEEDDGRYRIINKSTRSAEWSGGKMSWDSKEEAQKVIDSFSDKNDWAKRLNTTRQIAEYAKEQGYDSVVFRNIRDNGGQNPNVDFDTTADIYVVFDPNDVKSADVVTRDGNGEVIPLSQRFNAVDNDIRYSRTGESFASLMEQMEEKIKQYGGMELPGREIEVPKSVEEGTFVSRAASTLLNDPKIKGNEDAKGVSLRGIVEGDYNRKHMNLDEALRKSKESIEKLGYDNVVAEMRDRITDGSVLNEREMARYMTLREAAIEAGDWDAVQDCNVLIANSLTSSARNMTLARRLLEGLDGEHTAKANQRIIESRNEKAAERARKERGNVPQETIDRMRGKKAEMEKDYRQAETESTEKRNAVRDLRRHLDDLQKGIDQTVSDQKRTDRQTPKLAKELAQKMQDAVAATDSFIASEEKFQKTKQELHDAKMELARLKRQTKANERAESKLLDDLQQIGEQLETAVEEQRQSAEKLRETKKALDRSKEYRKLKEDLQKLGAGIEIPQAMWDELKAAKTPEEIEAAQARIFKEAADQLPPTLYERFMSWRYLAMLGNPKTWIKNEVGNLANYGLHKLDDTIAYALQKFFLKEGNRIVELNWRHTDEGKAIMDKVNEAADAATEREGSHKYTDAQSQIQDYRKRFNSNFLEKMSDGLDTALNEGSVTALTGGRVKLGAGDKPMFRANYVEALGNYMVANSLAEVTAEADAYATKVAQDYVFHTQNVASEVLTKFRNSGKVQKIIVDSLMPFIRTPANVLAQGLQRSPIGFAAAATKLAKAFAAQKRGTGSVTPDIINNMARSTTGAVLFTLGVLLSAVGVASGDEEGDDAKGRAAGELSGAQDLSFNIFGTRISFDWLEPASYPFLLGVLMQDGFSQDNPVGSLLDAASAGFGQVFEMSMLSGLLDAFSSNYGDGSGQVAQVVASVFENAATQSIPTLVGQLARAIDPIKRKTTSGESWITDALGKNLFSDTASTLAARIPGLSKTLEPERDVWGNEVGRVGDAQAMLLNAFQQLLSPAAIKVKGSNGEQADDLSAILADLYEKTEQGKVIPAELKAKDFKEKLDDEGLMDRYTSTLYQETREDVGKAQLEALWEMIDQNKAVKLTKTYKTANGEKKRESYTKRFADMDGTEKAKAVQKTAQDAKKELLDELLLGLEKGAKKT